MREREQLSRQTECVREKEKGEFAMKNVESYLQVDVKFKIIIVL